jgi:hypothetical protein
VGFFATLLLVAFSIRREHRLLRAAFCALVVFEPAYFLMGKLGEVRFFYELWAVVVIRAASSAEALFTRWNLGWKVGGERGIRTPGGLSPLT